jgi:hypothetical protein
MSPNALSSSCVRTTANTNGTGIVKIMVSAEMTLRGLVALIKFPGVSRRARRTATGVDARASKRRAIQNSQESVRALAKRYSINQKTVAKWKQRETVADLPTGSKEADGPFRSAPANAGTKQVAEHTDCAKCPAFIVIRSKPNC